MNCLVIDKSGAVVNVIAATVKEAQLVYTDHLCIPDDGAGKIGDVYDPVNRVFTSPQRSIDERRAVVINDLIAHRAARLTAGASHAGKLFAMDDTSRTDLASMATTAALVLAGALPWPDSYATGWIALDNTRLPLPTPAEGIALAAAVAGCYAAVIQHARDLKDTVLVADDPKAVDIELGW